MEDKTMYMVVHDNPYTGERVKMLVPSYDVGRTIETLESQGAKAGFWSLAGWQRVKRHVMSGQFQLS